jgi:hypothetical protein
MSIIEGEYIKADVKKVKSGNILPNISDEETMGELSAAMKTVDTIRKGLGLKPGQVRDYLYELPESWSDCGDVVDLSFLDV